MPTPWALQDLGSVMPDLGAFWQQLCIGCTEDPISYVVYASIVCIFGARAQAGYPSAFWSSCDMSLKSLQLRHHSKPTMPLMT